MTECPPIVEIATPKDQQEVFDLLCELHQENAMFEMDPEMVMSYIVRATNQDGGLIGVIKEKGKIVGCILLFSEKFWYAKSSYLAEYLNYIHPQYRKSNYAKDLIDFAKWSSEQMELPLIMGIMSTIRTRAKLHLLNKKMFFIGGLFAWNTGTTQQFEKIPLPERY